MKKYAVIAGLISLALVITGCNTKVVGTESRELEKGHATDHIHGIAYANDDNVYIATHEGMLSTDENASKWLLKGGYDFDFMGYHAMYDGTMITSGHPGKLSNLPNPLGVMVSTDNGGKWESQSLLGVVDFHILTSNFSNQDILYGVNQMDSGKYKAGIYKSTDKGKKWDKVKGNGLPEDLHSIYSLMTLPNDDNSLIAGTEFGVITSNDGGANWEVSDASRLITAISVLPDTQELLAYTITNEEAGMALSKDNGATWEYIGLNLGKDAVSYIGINPNDANKIVVATFENNVLLTNDGGHNWMNLIEKGIVQ